jgi:hypothetical protein
MTGAPNQSNEFVITFKPDATPEEEERFLTDFARVLLALARHIIDNEPPQEDRGEPTEL